LRAAAALSAALALLSACRVLPDIPTFACGNGVVEAGEDCDAYGRDDTSCRPAGEPGACHFDCKQDAAGNANVCPQGFGCDATAVCRRVMGGYAEKEVIVPGVASSLMSGDFDGDGRADVLSLETPGAAGLARPRVSFFDRDGALADTWSMTKLMATPVVTHISEDDRADLLSSTYNALSVLLGQPDRELITAISPSFYLPNTRVRLFPVLALPIERNTPLLIMTESDAGNTLAVSSADDPTLRPVANLPAGIDALAGEPTLGNINEDEREAPCLDLALGYLGANNVAVYQGCEQAADAPKWRKEAVVSKLPFKPASTVAGPPLLADLDGDGHLDLFVTSVDGPYAAYGDGRSLGVLEPFELTVVSEMPGPATPSPLAAGDITGDGLADFVDRHLVLLSLRQDDGRIVYEASLGTPVGTWSEARIADFTGDGQNDVVAVASGVPTLDFFLATGTNRLNSFTVQTSRPARSLCVSDLDGDSLLDVAFVEVAGPASEGEELAVSFGQLRASLTPPVSVAHLDGIEQLVGTAEHQQNTVSDLLITHRLDAAADGLSTGVSLVAGSGDRQLVSPMLLNSYSADGMLDSANSVALTAGTFIQEGELDVAAFAVPDSFGLDNDLSWNIWLLPDLRHGTIGPHKLSWEFDGRFTPVGLHDNSPELLVRVLAADLDKDGLDELVIAAPLRDEQRCLLQIGRIDPDEQRLTIHVSVEFEGECALEPPVAAEDIDGDGAKDLAVLTGVGASRRLVVLWNDGAGGFTLDSSTPVLADPTALRAFSLFRSTVGSPLRVAVVAESELRVLELVKKTRTFRDLEYGRALTNGTGVVAADVDGDSVADLVVADAGSLRVLRAALEGL
jgi:hypothetical protein